MGYTPDEKENSFYNLLKDVIPGSWVLSLADFIAKFTGLTPNHLHLIANPYFQDSKNALNLYESNRLTVIEMLTSTICGCKDTNRECGCAAKIPNRDEFASSPKTLLEHFYDTYGKNYDNMVEQIRNDYAEWVKSNVIAGVLQIGHSNRAMPNL